MHELSDCLSFRGFLRSLALIGAVTVLLTGKARHQTGGGWRCLRSVYSKKRTKHVDLLAVFEGLPGNHPLRLRLHC